MITDFDLVAALRRLDGKFDISRDLHGDAADAIEILEREKARICQAIGRYATLAPLDLKKPSEIQADLLAICGEKHMHKASIGSDECILCGHDLRHDVHIREARESSR